MNYPYESPHAQQTDHSAKPYLESKTNLAKLSWRIPLVGMLTSIVINVVAKPIGIVGAVVLFGSVLIGLVLSLVGIASSLKYSRVALHAICGLVLNSFLVILIFAMFHAISLARDAAIRAREKAVIENRNESSVPSKNDHNEP